jgi:predicted phosphodiesterase
MELSHEEAVSSDSAENSFVLFWVTDSHLNQITYPGRKDAIQWFVDCSNLHKPHLAVHTGDFIDGYNDPANSKDAFMEAWNQLGTDIYWRVIPGNRDVIAYTKEEWAAFFGYELHPMVLGSPFNAAFTLTSGSVSVRFLFLDYGTKLAVSRSMIISELTTATEDCVVIFTHNGTNWYTCMNDAYAAANRPDLKVYHIYGHHHPLLDQMYEFHNVNPLSTANIGYSYPDHPNLKGYLSPGIQDHPIARFNILQFQAGGNLIYQTIDPNSPLSTMISNQEAAITRRT